MTFKEYKKLYKEDGYCSLLELECIREESNPRSYKKILEHWQKAHYNQLEKLEKEMNRNEERR